MMNLKQTFLSSLQSEHTKTAYTKDITDFEIFLNAPIETASNLNAHEYKAHLKSIGLRPLSINRKIAAIRSFFEFVKMMVPGSINPFDSVKCESKHNYEVTGSFTDREVVAIIDSARNDIRDACILQILFFLGLRKSEVCNLKLSDLRLSSEVSTLSVLGKGNKIRILPLPKLLEKSLSEYTSLAHAHILRRPNPFLFPGKNSDSGLSPNSITNLLKKYSSLAGINRPVHVHMTRVTAVSSALSNGAPLEFVKEMGGWSGFDMVLRYDRRVKSLKQSAVYSVNYERKTK